MQSFVTIFLAGLATFAAFFMLNPEPVTEQVTFTSMETIKVELPDTGLPNFLIVAEYPLVLALEASAAYEGAIDFSVEGFRAVHD
ncbi:MAG: hypothetical protein AAFZ74_07280 [Pseudomonadota bacterium]